MKRKSQPRRNRIKELLAAKLTAMTGGRVLVKHCPASYLRGDEKAAGHLYSVEFADHHHPEVCDITLDDRSDDDMRMQLSRELISIASFYATLASMVAEGSWKGGAT